MSGHAILRRTLGALGIGAVAALALAPVAASAQERTLSIVAPWEIGGTDPSKSGYVFTRLEVAETLLDADDGGQPRPALAASWTVSDDRLTWRFRLRDGVRFHDGTPLTAEAAAASLRHALGKPGPLKQVPVAAVEADGAELVIRLSEPFGPLPAFLAHSSAQILAPAAYAENGQATQVIGTGPYRIERLEPPQRLVAARFPDYWGAKPAVERIGFLAAGRGETRALMAESGDADIVFTLDPASQKRLRANRKLQVHAVPIPRTVALKVNAGHPFLQDVRAREALSLTIDRAGIAAAILRTSEAAAGQLLPPSLPDWHAAGLAPLGRDVARASALLAELGWTKGADGILERGGQPFRLTLRTFSDRPELPLVATAIQDQARAAGIDLRVAIGNSSDIPAGHRDGTLELALMARNFGLVPDPLATLLEDFGPAGGDWGAMGWTEPRMEAVLAELRNATDPARRSELRRQAASLLQAGLPVIPVAWYQQTAAVSKRVEGFTIDPYERSYRLSRLRWAP